MEKVYITTPIYYVNANPHIGHAYTSIAADVLARHFRQKGDEVFFLTGTDEHGAKIAQAAEKNGKQPKEFVDEMSAKFEQLSEKLNLSNDAFIRTTDDRHIKIAQDFLQEIYDNGFIYKKSYKGFYCIACEEYKTEKDLEDGCCPIHKTKAEVQEEENWFFKLSSFQEELIDLIESDQIKIKPQGRKNEILGKLRLGLDDVSFSRENVEWSFSIPWDETQTVYVWGDALVNYFSACEIFKKREFWPPTIHLVGRDIIWFHAVIWPAMLLAAKKSLFKEILVNGYLTSGGQKMSKTLGNVIDPLQVISDYSVDTLRFYLLRDVPYGEDGDATLERIKERHNNDLAAGLGNLAQRVLSMVKRYEIEKDEKNGLNQEEIDKIHQLTEKYKFQEALSGIWELIARVNKNIAEFEPWNLAKEGKTDQLQEFLSKSYWQVLDIADLINPFLPETSEEIKKQAQSLELEPIFKKVE